MFRRSNDVSDDTNYPEDEEVVSGEPVVAEPVAAEPVVVSPAPASPAVAPQQAAPAATVVVPQTPAAPAVVVPQASVAPARTSLVQRSVATNGGAAAALGFVALVALIVGAWAGISPFVGPLFGFNGAGFVAWHWNLTHALVWLCPGAVAVFVGLLSFVYVPLIRVGSGRFGTWWSGLVLACCGGWLVVAPFAWRVFEGFRPIIAAGPARELLYLVGFSFGPGVLLVLAGGLAMGAALVSKPLVTEAAATTDVGEAPLAA